MMMVNIHPPWKNYGHSLEVFQGLPIHLLCELARFISCHSITINPSSMLTNHESHHHQHHQSRLHPSFHWSNAPRRSQCRHRWLATPSEFWPWSNGEKVKSNWARKQTQNNWDQAASPADGRTEKRDLYRPVNTIADIRLKHEGHFFDPHFLPGFEMKIPAKAVYPVSDGAFFITKERKRARYSNLGLIRAGQWFFTVRHCDCVGRIKTISAFREFATLKTARTAASLHQQKPPWKWKLICVCITLLLNQVSCLSQDIKNCVA